MSQELLLSIAIVTYNRSNELIRALKSCYPIGLEDYEIVVWDNQSNEINRNMVESFCGSYDVKIQYYYSNKNLGCGGGRNAAWKKCKGKYVFMLDDDAIIHSENFFVELINYMKNNDKAGATYVKIFEPETNHIYDCEYKEKCTSGAVKAFSYVGGAHILRKDLFPQKNLYPKYSMFGSEETYASLLIWDSGHEVHYFNKLSVHHIPTAVNRKIGTERDRLLILTAYGIKKMLFPLMLLPIEYVLFRMHMYKNCVKYDEEAKEMLRTMYDRDDVHRISVKCLLLLIEKFGIKCII